MPKLGAVSVTKTCGRRAGSLAREGRWWYQLADVTDRTLMCTARQHWDIAVFRSRSMLGPWRAAPASPLLRGRGPATGRGGCSISYPTLAALGDGRTFLAYTLVPSAWPAPNEVRLAVLR